MHRCLSTESLPSPPIKIPEEVSSWWTFHQRCNLYIQQSTFYWNLKNNKIEQCSNYSLNGKGGIKPRVINIPCFLGLVLPHLVRTQCMMGAGLTLSRRLCSSSYPTHWSPLTAYGTSISGIQWRVPPLFSISQTYPTKSILFKMKIVIIFHLCVHISIYVIEISTYYSHKIYHLWNKSHTSNW